MSRTSVVIGLGLLLVGLLLNPALAAGDAAHGEKVSPFQGNLGNAIWTLLIFGLVLGVLARYAWGPLLAALQNREKFIRDSLESARRDREACELRLKEYEERLAKAREEASAIVEEGRRDAEAAKRRIEEEARRSADTLVERARRDIGIARDSALKELYEQSAQLAMSMAASVLKRQVTPEDQQRLIHDALDDLAARKNGAGARREGAAQ